MFTPALREHTRANPADTPLLHQSGRLHAAVYVAQLLPAERDRAHRLRVRFLRRPLHARGRREPRPTYVLTRGQTHPMLTGTTPVPVRRRCPFISACADYPRTLRTWGRRLRANQWALQETLAARHPALRDRATYGAFLRKWEYLFAYAAAGFAKGYITCHMLTFVRAVRALWRASSLRRARADADDTILYLERRHGCVRLGGLRGGEALSRRSRCACIALMRRGFRGSPAKTGRGGKG